MAYTLTQSQITQLEAFEVVGDYAGLYQAVYDFLEYPDAVKRGAIMGHRNDCLARL